MAVSADLRLRWNIRNSANSGYADILDLRLGDMTVGAGVDQQRYLDEAWDEIEARLGFRYVVPLPEDLPHHTVTVLKRIHALMASGNLILEMGIGSEKLQSFGLWLQEEAEKSLTMMVDGKMDIAGLEERPTQLTGVSNAPTVLVADAVSPFDVFDQFAYGRRGYGPRYSGPYYCPPVVEPDGAPVHDPNA